MMKRKTWLTIGIAALLLFCTAVLAEGANRNVPLDSALDAALNAPGSVCKRLGASVAGC
ncbi:MAG TPA: hypothetical protein PK062_07555 [Clostridia bacterium]|nr:hypothetical protein [Clostridia bacterium]